MKFTNGQWLVRDGFTIYGAVEVRGVKAEKDSLTVYAPDRHIQNRGNTLGNPLLSIRYSSPAPDIIRVEAVHYSGRRRLGPDFELSLGNPPVEVACGETEATFTSGKLAVRVKLQGPWDAAFTYDGKPITGSPAGGTAWISGPDGRAWMREQLTLGVGECVYGLGERFTNFVKNGQSVDVWNRDGGTSSDQAYKCIPFYVTNRGYGVFVNSPGLVSYEIASEHVARAQFSVEAERLDYFIIGGETLQDVLKNYTKLTGRPVLPPAWSFGLWLSTSFTTDYDETTVNSFLDGMAGRDIPMHVFHFDCFWMKEYQWCDFEWDRDVFPDPVAMLKRLRERGLKICVWINPYIAQKSPLFEEGRENGYLVLDQHGNVWQWDMWQSGMGLVDFTNPDATAWYLSKLKALLDMGVDSFKTDFGERIPTDVRWHDGSDPEKMHNYYAFLFNQAVFGLIERERGVGEAVVFARSATVGGQRFPTHWGGDNTANYPSMAESLRGGLSLALAGFGYWGHDIGGFEATATPDLYKRWAAFGLLSPYSRLHGSSSYRVPWLFDDEAVDVLRRFTRLKCTLMPYLYDAACETAETGVPMMRPMMLEFGGEPYADTLDRQYMLGGRLLVAPIFSESGDVDYFLPEGTWTNILTGETAEGGVWQRERHGYMSLPLMARPGSLIAFGASQSEAAYDYASGAELRLYALEEGRVASARVRDTKGGVTLDVTVARVGDILIVRAQGAGKPWKLVLAGIHAAKSATGAGLLDGPDGIVVTPGAFTGEFTVEL